MKPLIARLHKYVALSLGILVALMGFTGSLLVFREDFEERLHPERQVRWNPGMRVSYEAVLRAARDAVPVAEKYVINVPENPDRVFNVDVEKPDGRRMFIDPYSGKLISNTDEAEFAFDWIVQWHTHLLAGDTGKYLVAGIGAILLFMGITGVVLWWPRKLGGAFRIRWEAKRMGLSYDLHRVAGAVFCMFFFLSALTGIVLAFPLSSAELVGALAGNPPPAAPRLSSRPPGATRSPLDDIVTAANDAFPVGQVRRVIVPNGEEPVQVRMRVAGDDHPYGLNRVYVDPYGATVIGVAPIATASPGHRMFDWLYPLHLGRLFGTAHQLLQLIIGLVPAFLLTTGLIMWQARRSARKRSGVKVTSTQQRSSYQ